MSVNVKKIISDIELKIEEPVKALKKYELKEKNAAYYKEHKDKINAHNKKITQCCLCDKELRQGSLRSHQKSKLCVNQCELKLKKIKMGIIK
jgi:hypothetical protein